MLETDLSILGGQRGSSRRWGGEGPTPEQDRDLAFARIHHAIRRELKKSPLPLADEQKVALYALLDTVNA